MAIWMGTGDSIVFKTKRSDTLTDKAEDLIQDAGKSLSELGREAQGRAKDVKKDMVKTLHTAAHTMRKEARDAGASKDVRRQVDSVAKSFDRAAHYLNKHSYEDIGEDVVSGVRSNPWRLLAVIFVIGLVIGLLMRDNGGQDDRNQMDFNYNGTNTYR